MNIHIKIHVIPMLLTRRNEDSLTGKIQEIKS